MRESFSGSGQAAKRWGLGVFYKIYGRCGFAGRYEQALAAVFIAFALAYGFSVPAFAQTASPYSDKTLNAVNQPLSIPYAAPDKVILDKADPERADHGPSPERQDEAAQESPPPPESHMGTIRIGLHDGIPPYVISNPLEGMDISILERVFERAGYEVEFILAPVRRLPVMFENGQIDAYTTYEPAPSGAFASLHFRHWHDGVIVRKGLEITRDNIDEWNVGTFPGAVEVMGDVLGPYREAVRTGTVAESSIQAANLFSGGRIDVYVGDVFTFFYHYRSVWGVETPLPRILEFFPPFAQRLIFDDEAMQKRFDAALLEARRDGVIEQIFVNISLDTLTLTASQCAYRDPFVDESDFKNLKDLTKNQSNDGADKQAMPHDERCR